MLNIDKIIILIKKREHGIATVFALGFLSLLFMLSAVYITSSMIERKASENTNALQSARMLVQTGLNRSMASLNRYILDNTVDLSDIYTYNSDADYRSSDNLDNLLETTVDGVTYYKAADYSEANGPHWQYLPEEHGADTPIIGRFAYMVLAQSGKLDLSACLDSGQNASILGGSAVSEADGSGKTSLQADGTYVIGRPGRNINEIYLTSIDNSNTWFSDYSGDVSSFFASPAGELKGQNDSWKAQWDDFTTLFDKLSLDDDAVRNSFQSHFSIGNSPDAEAFWVDDGDGIRESNEFYKRFQLNRTDWNSIEVDSFIVNPILNTSSDTNISILWLKNWKDVGGMQTIINSKKQIIANLIDYNDSDTIATTDDPDNPTYVGLETVPYANEVYLKIPGSITVTKLITPIDTDNDGVPDYVEIYQGTDSENINKYEDDNSDGIPDYVERQNETSYEPDLVFYEQPYYELGLDTDFNAGLLLNYYDINNYDSNDIFYRYDFYIDKPELILELVNLYSTGVPGNLDGKIPTKANVSLSINYIFGDKNNPGEFESLHEDVNYPFERSYWTISDKEYEYYNNKEEQHGALSEDDKKAFFPSFPKTITVIDQEYTGNPVLYAFVNHIKVKVTNFDNDNIPENDVLFDYSYVVNTTQPDTRQIIEYGVTDTRVTVDVNGVLHTYPISYQVQDPRQNLYETDWEEQIPKSEYEVPLLHSISGQINDVDDKDDLSKNKNYPQFTSNVMDEEYYHTDTSVQPPIVYQPWDISTAYIRNAPMQSPWELGFIHRGEKWQTLNLKKYNMNEWDAGSTGGGNSYSDGDANLLDQIKMTESTLTQGKVNINSQIKETLKVLFEEIRVGSDIGSSKGPGTLKMADGSTNAYKVDASDAEALADEIIAITSNTDSEFLTRAQILLQEDGKLWNNTLGLNQVTDATQEEIIGKFINLCKTSEQNTFYIIVVAQKIKDVGIKGKEFVVKKDGNNDGIESTVSVKLGRYDSDGDEIMATQKIFAVIKYSGTSFYINYFKYLNN